MYSMYHIRTCLFEKTGDQLPQFRGTCRPEGAKHHAPSPVSTLMKYSKLDDRILMNDIQCAQCSLQYEGLCNYLFIFEFKSVRIKIHPPKRGFINILVEMASRWCITFWIWTITYTILSNGSQTLEHNLQTWLRRYIQHTLLLHFQTLEIRCTRRLTLTEYSISFLEQSSIWARQDPSASLCNPHELFKGCRWSQVKLASDHHTGVTVHQGKTPPQNPAEGRCIHCVKTRRFPSVNKQIRKFNAEIAFIAWWFSKYQAAVTLGLRICAGKRPGCSPILLPPRTTDTV
jgi:hypothetical protein